VSAADWNEYGLVALTLIGKPLQVTGVTNSLKLRADPSDQRRSYIWVDPPWELLKDGVRHADSTEYPHHEDVDYRERHEEWAKRVGPLLEGATLLDVRPGAGGSTLFSLSGAVLLQVGSTDSRADHQWYDDWHAKE
jgi:hypothetical protein